MTVLHQEYRDGIWREPTPLRSVARLDCYSWLAWEFAGWVAVCAFGAALVAIALDLDAFGRTTEKLTPDR